MTPEELQLQLEGWDFEAKRATGKGGKGGIPDSMWETYSALANTDGGKIVLGVSEKSDGTLKVTGIEAIEKLESDLWNALNNPQKVSVNLLSRGDVERLTINDAAVMVITVPRAERRQRPVFIKGNLLTGTYRRNFEGDYRCKDDQVRRMVADADDRPRDAEILEHFSMADLDPETLSAYRNLFRSNHPTHPFLAGDDKTLLGQLGGWTKDRQTGTEGVTLAGLLMFGKRRAILDKLPYYNLDYRELPNAAIQNDTRWLDRIWVDGTWSGNLLDFYQRVFRKLTADLKVPFRLEKLFRRDETLVHEGLREALVNALIHADHTGTTGIRVFKKTDGFEFINPGGLRIPVDTIWQGGTSDCRNPAIQVMFQMIGAGEKAGSGFPKIRRAWEEQHWKLPNIYENIGLDETTLSLSLESLMPQDTVDYLVEHVPDFRELPERQRLILLTVYGGGEVKHPDLAKVVPGHSRDLTLDLQSLIRRGLLDRIGAGKGCAYQLASLASSHGEERSLIGNDDTLQDSLIGNDETLQAPPGGKAMGELDKKQTLSMGSRSTPQQMRDEILKLCRGRYLSRSELSTALGRNAVFLGSQYLKPMVEEGLLKLRYPDTPTHSGQAYRTVSSAKAKDE